MKSMQGVLTYIVTGLLLTGITGCVNFPVTITPVENVTSATLTSAASEYGSAVTATYQPPSTLTPTTTPYPNFEPAGCLLPGEDYTLVEVNGWYLNQRTLEMLRYASQLYNGDPEYLPARITQGSYHDNGAASWGTHLGGGAVDLSVMLPGTYTIDAIHISSLIRAMRAAGFAAWYRDTNELYSDSAPHIHAIAVGDDELSQPALAQLINPEGYFWGFNGIPVQKGQPFPDRHGGAVVCNWMKALGYAPADSYAIFNSPWQARLKTVARAVQTKTEQETRVFAESIGFYPGTQRGLLDLDVPLVIWLLHESGILTSIDSPVYQLPGFRLANLDSEWRFWSQFPERDYMRYDFDTPPGQFDFNVWQLQAGDVVITQVESVYTRVFLVTEADVSGKVYGIAPVAQPDGSVLVQVLLLYDPTSSGVGYLRNDWSGCKLANCENNAGFSILRRNDLHLLAGSLIAYWVQPGDTLPLLAGKYDSSIAAIIEANPGMAVEKLVPGETLNIPVNLLQPTQ